MSGAGLSPRLPENAPRASMAQPQSDSTYAAKRSASSKWLSFVKSASTLTPGRTCAAALTPAEVKMVSSALIQKYLSFPYRKGYISVLPVI